AQQLPVLGHEGLLGTGRRDARQPVLDPGVRGVLSVWNDVVGRRRQAGVCPQRAHADRNPLCDLRRVDRRGGLRHRPSGSPWLGAAAWSASARPGLAPMATRCARCGASIGAASYASGGRVIGERAPWVAAAVGLFLVVYYPLVAVGGYLLSELPFCFCLTISV